MPKSKKYKLNISDKKDLANKILQLIKKNLLLEYNEIIQSEKEFILKNVKKLQYIMEEDGYGLKENILFKKPTKMVDTLATIFGIEGMFKLYKSNELYINTTREIINEIEDFLEFISNSNQTDDEIEIFPSLKNLEKILIEAIYDQYMKNPSLYHSKSDVPSARKKAIKKRDGYKCQYCGSKFDEEELEVDHIYPRSMGGSNHPQNLMTLCSDHNRKKLDSLDYFKDDEGMFKMKENIEIFVKETQLIGDFGNWINRMSDARVRCAWINKKKKEINKEQNK